MKKTILGKFCAIVATLMAIHSTYAADSTLAQQLKTQYPNLDFKNIQPTEVKQLYSATLDDQIVYLDPTGQYVILGSMIRLKDQKNLTKALSMSINKIDWSSLPLNDAIQTVKGNGQRKIAVFSDPYCPYCKRLEAELAQLSDVTIYTFIFPIRQQSIAPAQRVWCSANKAYAWNRLITQGILPQANANCSHPIDRNLTLGRKLGIDGTPGIIFSNGMKSMGYMSKQDIENTLKEIQASK
ncbi:DsbC family protein [Acinetobacter apis]|uniref:Thiol:disulfide interchange protein n=2 Tax=Acinetobacter apis TaxID=1229165 RepID=A0A217EI92_9GAMM|nr:Thiol:disulfide interchange protein DsbC [Acinetobacter apis]